MIRSLVLCCFIHTLRTALIERDGNDGQKHKDKTDRTKSNSSLSFPVAVDWKVKMLF